MLSKLVQLSEILIDGLFVSLAMTKLRWCRQKNVNGNTVGIDVGLKNWIMLDSGEVIDRPRFQDAAIDKINKLQRDLSRKKIGSKNRWKAALILKKAWRRVRLQRVDYY
ncbi:MAG: transposase [Candidatus Nitrosopolaris sp.]